MAVNEVGSKTYWPVLVVGLLALVWMSGCATATGPVQWPDVEAASQPPADGQQGEPHLIRGTDGFLYAVGEFESTPRTGQIVFGRYAGEWPLDESIRPALFAGQVVRATSEGSALIHPLYVFPETDVVGLRVEFADERGDESMGKGLGDVEDVDFSGPTHLRITPSSDDGVQEGDLYGIFRPHGAEDSPRDVQLTRRLLGVCMIVESTAAGSTCRLWQGHPDHEWAGRIEAGQQVLFLEPSFGRSPRQATVLVSPVEGNDELNAWVLENLRNYFSRFPGGEVLVESYEEEVDATDKAFYRWGRRIETDESGLFVGVSVVQRQGRDHLVLNYTGIGPVVGSGMVAAPPEGGVDMGRLDRVDSDDWSGFASVLMGTVMVYRGQTSLALVHLNEALRDRALHGPWRWHARDQYAMRWGALDRFEEAMWLVREDEAVARAEVDEEAYLNALGTRVRIHDFLDQPSQARQAAAEYLEARRADRPGSGYLSALAMYAEMAIQDDDAAAAREAISELEELCPDGCSGDLIGYLAGIYWGAFDVDAALQDGLVQKMVELGRLDENSSLASARLFQGWTFLRDRDLEQALIAFMEAQRLFEREGMHYAVARTQFYLAIAQIGRGESQSAFEYAVDALDFMTDVGDYPSTVRIYERLSQIYMNFEPTPRLQPFLAAAVRVLQGGLQAQISTGNLGGAAEASFGYGHFLYRVGQANQARAAFQQAVVFGVRGANLEVMALSHYFLARMAYEEGDMSLFQAEIGRAQRVAEAAEEDYILELIDDLLEPSGEPEDPTQLL